MDKKTRPKGRLIVISGPAGVGKGTIIRRLLEKCPEIRLSVSETTRDPRKGEQHGVDYFFVTKEIFKTRIAEGYYLEYDDHYEHFYGTPAGYVQEQLNRGFDIILEIEYKGAAQIRDKGINDLSIFILPPTPESLSDRLEGRDTETQEQLELRGQRALEEINAAYDYDYIIINDDLEQAVDEMMTVICAEKNKTLFMKNKIDEIIGGFNGLSEK